MSLTCHKEIRRVGRVGRGCYEDASDLSATSRACRTRGIWRTTRHTDKRAALYTAADRRPTNQVSAWQAGLGSRPTRPLRATSSLHPREYVARVGHVGEDVTRMLRGWYKETAHWSPRDHAHTRCTLSLLQPRPRRTPHRASVKLMNYLGRHSTLTFDLDL